MKKFKINQVDALTGEVNTLFWEIYASSYRAISKMADRLFSHPGNWVEDKPVCHYIYEEA